MRIDDWDELHAMVVEAAEELFASVGIATTYAGPMPHRDVRWAETLSIIGLGGNLRGTLVLSIPSALGKRSHPAGGTEPRRSRRLAGGARESPPPEGSRIRLLARGVGIELQYAAGDQRDGYVSRVERFAGTPVVHSFRLGEETICVVFEAVSQQQATLSVDRLPAAVAAGAMINF